jgi:hypothetical protein
MVNIINVGSGDWEWQNEIGAAVGLEQVGRTVLKHKDVGVAETPDTPQGAEVVIERTIFLHQNNDVLHVLDGAGARVDG